MYIESHTNVSPNFNSKKLEPPFYKDVLDVFEDRVAGWLIMPAKKLLDIPHCSIAAVALATNYIEGIEIYISGNDSKGKSQEFFRRGFKAIFTGACSEEVLDAIANAIYESLRCGFSHDGMSRNRIYFSTARKEAFTVTWPKKNGEFVINGKLESAVINPTSFVESIELHFKQYIKKLRSKNSTEAKDAFLKAINLKWQLEEETPLIAMTEKEFYNKS